jgi:RNA polymerase-binding transcription factor DksA
MSKKLTQPPCSYCKSPTEPLGQKKLEITKYFYCCNPCKTKHELLLTYEGRTLKHKDEATATYLMTQLRSAIDMLYTSECMKKQDCVFIFTDSVDSFRLEGECKQEYINTLQLRGKELLNEIEKNYSSDKIRITKE